MKSDRLVSVLLLLQSSTRRTARELATALEVSERTVYRDVDSLAASGVPIYTERGVEGGIFLSEGYRSALLHFAEDEIRALFASGANPLADLGLDAGLALDKLQGGLSDVQRRVAERARSRIHLDMRRWNQSDPPREMLALLRRAVWDDRRLSMEYEDRRRAPTSRVVDPMGLVSKAGVWYLVARVGDDYRTFRVDRIRKAVELAERFERDPAFDLESHWAESKQTFASQSQGPAVTVAIDVALLDEMRGFWPVEILERGAERAVLRLIFPNEEIAVRELLVWGSSVTLLEPLELCARVVERAVETIEHYSQARR